MKVSVVIPVYNGAEFLEGCLRSVISQSYRNIEVIVIDDGSTDKTPDICKKIAGEDGRILVVKQHNAGVSAARNKGIAAGTGEFIVFVDADDTLPNKAIEIMLEQVDHNTDFIIGSHREVRGRYSRCNHRPTAIFKGAEIESKLNVFDPFISTPWAKLYKRDIIQKEKIAFNEELPFGEDHVFNLVYSKHIMQCKVIKDVVYNYTLGGLASSAKYYPDMNRYCLNLLEAYTKLGDIGNNEFCAFFKKKIRVQLFASATHYLSFCKKKEAIEQIKATFSVFSNYLTDDWLDTAYFSKKECCCIAERNAEQLATLVMRKNIVTILKKKMKLACIRLGKLF